VILVHITTLYPGYLADFERRHGSLAQLSYAEHRAALYRDAFGWSDYFCRHLATRGHATEHIVANYPALQGKWAAENGIPCDRTQQIDYQLVAAQIRARRPEMLFVDDCYAFAPARLKALRESFPFIRAVTCHHGLDGDPRSLFVPDALVLSPAAHQVREWSRLGSDTALLRHAFEPSVLSGPPSPGPRSRLTFLGSCSPLMHPERHEWLAAVGRERPDLELWTDSFDTLGARTLFASLARGRGGRIWRHFTSPLRRKAQPPLFGRAMFARLRDSQITLNCHISLAQRSAGNMRLFEATGAGACLVTDERDDLAEIFQPDTEVVTFGTTQECIERLRWLSDHPQEAAEIAARGQRRTLEAHTFALRAAELELLMEKKLQASRRS
jgi:spore maturation protein CgeB